jgi:hypothetical protein
VRRTNLTPPTILFAVDWTTSRLSRLNTRAPIVASGLTHEAHVERVHLARAERAGVEPELTCVYDIEPDVKRQRPAL